MSGLKNETEKKDIDGMDEAALMIAQLAISDELIEHNEAIKVDFEDYFAQMSELAPKKNSPMEIEWFNTLGSATDWYEELVTEAKCKCARKQPSFITK